MSKPIEVTKAPDCSVGVPEDIADRMANIVAEKGYCVAQVRDGLIFQYSRQQLLDMLTSLDREGQDTGLIFFRTAVGN